MEYSSLIAAIEPQVQTYLAYMATRPNGEEIEYRTPFETLFNTLQIPFLNKTSIVQEDRRSGIEIDGMPDFFVWNDADTLFKSLIGFIECKKPSFNLDKLIESVQIKKYSKTCKNIIITNYKRFILLQEGKKQHDITLAADTKTLLDFVTLLQDFYGYKYPYIKTKKSLVSALAAQSFYYAAALREFLKNKDNEQKTERNFYRKLNGLFEGYENSLNYYYELEDFCDIYAQSLVFGLLLARLDTEEELNEKELDYLAQIPLEYILLKEFLSSGYSREYLPVSIKTALTNIGKNLNLININEIKKEFANTNNGRQNVSVYLYEDFLKEYDKLCNKDNRKRSGVYYTPAEATNFITKSVNHLIKTKLNIPQGYNAENVKVLDFACGTGTFIHSVFEQMIPENPDTLEKQILKNKITKDIYGFELLFTPYIIAHTVLTRFLKEKKIDLKENERLAIYLTNTLDISQHSISDLLPNLQDEYETAMEIKDKTNLLAIIGNPPYFNGKSREKSDIIDAELQKYKDGLNEKKINLDDLYIKFIRFAEWKIQRSGHGIVGIITNNSYLHGVTYRQMRKHLYETFDEIYILNLHGDADRKEPDKNIFDIKRGVCISIFVKHKNPLKQKKVYYFSTLENGLLSRAEKLSFLENNTFDKLKWQEVKTKDTENYWFMPKDFSEGKIYKKFWKLTDIFQSWNSGPESGNDDAAIFYTRKELDKRCKDYITLPEHILRKKYNIVDKQNWILQNAIDDLKNDYNPQILYYRPFDKRWTSLSKNSKRFLGRPRYEIIKHFDNKENIGIIFKKELNRGYFNTILVVDKIFDRTILETSHGGSYVAPLYFYNGSEHPEMLQLDFEGEGEKFANFSENFIKNYIGKMNFKPAPEEILAYIYGVLHSKVYREKYVEFLKTDFPAVPMTTNRKTFDKYAVLGQKLIDLHLFKNLPKDMAICINYDFNDDFVVEKIAQNNNKLFLYTANNKTITFDNVTPQIYNFEIGSYKPIEKWLKYRIKDNVTLSFSDMQHLKNMIIAIKNTIQTMQEIEALGEEYLK